MCGTMWCIYGPDFADRSDFLPNGRLWIRRGIFLYSGVAVAARRCFGRGEYCAADAVGKERIPMKAYKYPSPCLSCSRVQDPRMCDNKNCKPWRQWFLDRWALIHSYPRRQMEQAELKPVGVNVGGKHYAAPHQVRAYLKKDPCQDCVCPKELCSSPCRVRRAWEETKKEVFL